MPYNPSTGRLSTDSTYGISLSEIRRCLGEAPGADLSRSGRIRPWAKFKPMPIGDMSGYTTTQAKLINYGLFVPRYSNMHDMALDIQAGTWTRATNYDANKTFWTNRGLGSGDWARVLDFDGYWHYASEIMTAITMDAASYAAGDIPSFQTYIDGAADGNIKPADISLVDNGSLTMENLYYGIYFHGSNGGFYKVLGRTATLGSATLNIYDSAFLFPRHASQETIQACMFLCDANYNNGAVGTSDAVNGNFIPVIPSRAILTPYFDSPKLNLSGDPANIFMPLSGGNAAFVFKAMPDSFFPWNCFIEATYIDNGQAHVVIDTVDVELNFGVQFDSLGNQKPYYIRIDTDRANAAITAKIYVTDPAVDFVDVLYNESSLGTPAQTVIGEIGGGEILTSPSAVEKITSVGFYATYDNDVHEDCEIP